MRVAPSRGPRSITMATMDVKKRAFDLTLSLAVLSVGWPLIMAIAVAMRASRDRGPIFYRSQRVGEGGRTFNLLKFRTMLSDSKGSRLTAGADPRVTPLGRFLRAYKIDEFPQLWNVVRGEMSLVGPRPEDPRFVDMSDPLHHLVFTATPGITGLAQLRFRHEERLLDGPDPEGHYRTMILPEKLKLDALYLERQSLRLDAKILLETAKRVLR